MVGIGGEIVVRVGRARNRPCHIGRKRVWTPTEKKETTKVEAGIAPIKISREITVTKKKLPWRMTA
jgi:hypothetical protein